MARDLLTRENVEASLEFRSRSLESHKIRNIDREREISFI